MDIGAPRLLMGELFAPRTEEISRMVWISLLLGYVPFLCASFESSSLSPASRDFSTAWAELDFQESGVGGADDRGTSVTEPKQVRPWGIIDRDTPGGAASQGPLYL